MFTKVKDTFLVIILVLIVALFYRVEVKMDEFESNLEQAEGTVSLQMYESIEKWADSFEVPKYIAYNVAYRETGYKGPFDFDYNPYQVSSAGAVGPMQIIHKWSRPFTKKKVSVRQLKRDIDLNVMVSMKMLRKWYSIHRDWTLACGAYNSGQPIRNDYAIYCASNKDYKKHWNKL